MLIYYLCFMQSITVVILLFGVNRDIKLNRYVNILAKHLRYFKMTDDIIDQLLGETTTGEITDEVAEKAVPIKQKYKTFGSAISWRSDGFISR